VLFAPKLFSGWSGPEHNPEIENPKLPTNKKKVAKANPYPERKHTLSGALISVPDDAPVSHGAAISS